MSRSLFQHRRCRPWVHDAPIAACGLWALFCATIQPARGFFIMDSTLRPMSTSQVLDRTFFLYRKNFALFAGVAAVTPALSILLQLAFVPLGFPPQNPQATGNLAAFYGLLLIYSLCGLL